MKLNQGNYNLIIKITTFLIQNVRERKEKKPVVLFYVVKCWKKCQNVKQKDELTKIPGPDSNTTTPGGGHNHPLLTSCKLIDKFTSRITSVSIKENVTFPRSIQSFHEERTNETGLKRKLTPLKTHQFDIRGALDRLPLGGNLGVGASPEEQSVAD